MAWRSGRATRALLVTVGLSSTAIAAYYFLRRKTDSSPLSNEAMAQIDASLKAGSAADEGGSVQEKPVESKTVAKSSDKPKKRLDEEQLSSELNKLNIHAEAMTPQNDSTPATSTVTPTPVAVKSSVPAQKSSIAGRTHPDSGVVSPCGEAGSSTPVPRMAPTVPGQTKTRSNSTDGGLGGSLCGEEEAETGSTEEGQALSDSGQGSETDEQSANHVVSYHFHVPNWLCGKFIGLQGSVIKQFKTASNCTITLKAQSNTSQTNSKNHKHHNRHHNNDQHSHQVCIIDGTRVNIEKCLELIRDKFPLEDYPEFSLEQVNCPLEDPSNITTSIVSPQQALATGIMQELVVSAINSGGYVSVQLPNNFYFSSLEQLTNCMYHTYFELDTPSVPRPVLPNVLCVAPYENQWYRVQVISYDSVTDSCDARFVDFGGFATFRGVDLRQIRTDFTTLPFQATDCYLSNVMPSDGEAWSPESATVLHELISSKACSGRMVGYATDGSPFIELYVTENPPSSNTSTNKTPTEPVLVNRTLVDRGVASWVEHEVPVLGGLVPGVWCSSDEKFVSCLLDIYADKHTLFWSPWDLNTKPMCWDDKVSADVPRPQMSPINDSDDNARLQDFEIMNQKNAKRKLYRIKQKIRNRSKAKVQ